MEPLLGPVGLGEVDSAVYLRLLAAPRGSVPELAAALDLTESRVGRTLETLTEHGLVTRLAGDLARYVPAPPDLAIDALAFRRQEGLERLRAAARDLTRQMALAPAGGPGGLVEVIEGDQAVLHQIARLQLGAEREVAIVDCPPYLLGQPQDNEEQRQVMRRGVSYRAIYHAPVLHEPEKMRDVLDCIAAGEDARALPDVELKMTIVDRRVALIPLTLGATDTHTRILVHPSPLLSTLIMCFDLLWERATPLAGRERDEGPGPRDRAMLAMLAAGMKDRAVARALGVTERTVTRRITLLMAHLGVETRFQAALQASRRGWL
ncbi:helix-turn-helix domain-containing protein [Longispora sp. NPDC051575]|uniref:helix-turn-helix domain-containing protein n=1 Tax=Longispora sp. NPDC051575 TaxID=3154943 RepID=UPI00343F7B95